MESEKGTAGSYSCPSFTPWSVFSRPFLTQISARPKKSQTLYGRSTTFASLATFSLLICDFFCFLLRRWRSREHVACITGALLAKRGDLVILNKALKVSDVRDKGRRKIKRLLPVHCSGPSAHLRPQVLTDRGDVKRTNQNTIHYSKIVTFQATRNTDSSINHRT